MPIDASDVHRGQFVMTCSSAAVQAGWATRPIAQGWFLHHHPTADVRTGDDGSILIGSAAQLRSDQPAPLEVLSRPSFDRSDTDSWAGRWGIIKGDLVASDVSALLGLVYGETQQGACVSSSLALLALLNGDEDIPEHAAMKGWGLDWMPPPLTILPGVRRLLPGQTLRLEQGAVTLGPRAPGLLAAQLTADEATAAFADALVQGLRGFASGYLLPLTAGLDSRTVLAALHVAGKPFVAFTHQHKAMSHGDRTIPAKLARRSGFEHRAVNDGAYVREAEGAIDAHSHGQLHQNRHFFAHDHYAALEAHRTWTMLPGGCFEVGRCFYWPYLPETLPADADDAVEAIIAGLNAREAAPILRDGLRAWLLDLRSRAAAAGDADWRDTFYLEQRLAGWLATTEQATDLNGIRKLHIANSRYIFELMLALPPEQRRAGTIQRGAIERLTPNLLHLPVNPRPPIHVRAKAKVGAALRKARLR